MFYTSIPTEIIIAIWLALSFVAGILGHERSCTFLGAFSLSIALSPLVGFIIVMASERNSDREFKKIVVNSLRPKSDSEPEKEVFKRDILKSDSEEWEEIKRLYKEGHITEKRYQELKAQILGL